MKRTWPNQFYKALLHEAKYKNNARGIYPEEYTFFYKQHFYKQQQGLKLAKNKDIAKHPEADFLTKIFR